MGLDVRLVRERVICDNGWTPRRSYDFSIIERETFDSWHRFYPLINWIIKKRGLTGRPVYEIVPIELGLEELEELYDILTKVLKTHDQSLFPEGEIKTSQDPNVYWGYIGDLQMLLRDEIEREKKRREINNAYYSKYFIDAD